MESTNGAASPNGLSKVFRWGRPAYSRSQSTPLAKRNQASELPPSSNAPHYVPEAGPSLCTPPASMRSSTSGSFKSRLLPKRPFFQRKSASLSKQGSRSPLGSPSSTISIGQPSPPTEAGRGPGSDLREDVTPMQENVRFNVQTPSAGPLPISSLSAMQALSSFLLQPTSLTLMHLSPSSIVAQQPSNSPYSAGHDAPSTTSLSTYISEHATNNSNWSSAHTRSIAPSSAISSRNTSAGFNEQLAASALSLPAVSIAAVFRAITSLAWINANVDRIAPSPNSYMAFSPESGSRSPATSSNPPTVFELGALLQSVLDVLSSYSTNLGVELVLYHGAHPTEQMQDFQSLQMKGGIQELNTRGDETGLGVAFMAIICQILSQAKPGDTLEVGLVLKPLFAHRPSYPRRDTAGTTGSNLSQLSSFSEDEPEAPVIAKTWQASVEICHQSSRAPDMPTLDPLQQPLIATLAKLFGMMVAPVVLEPSGSRKWFVEGHFLQHGKDETAGTSRRKGSSSEGSRDPSIADLFRFAESALKGKKVVIHSAQQSLFAKHLTGYLTSWGLEPHHVAIDRDRTNDSVTESWQSQKAADSKDRSFGTESSNSHSDAPAPVSPPQPELLLPSSSSSSKATPAEALDPSISFLFIDDDISTLRKQLILVKNAAPSVHLQNAFLSKRPGLASRRTRSSAQIRPAMPAVALSIIYFTSLSKFRYIRELVQSIFRSVSHMFPLPEVLVLPKPVGPRRLLTALHTAVRRPLLDPTVVPIATSPSSPGGHYFFASSARPSPAPSNQQDFELAFAEAGRVGEIRETSPTLGAPSGTSARPAVSNGSSPHASAEAVEYMEYMSKSAADMGNSASSGIVIQSPDGKTSGLFFHPIKKAGPPGSSSLRESTGPTSRMVRERMPTAEMDSAEEPDEPVLREVGQPSPLLIPSPVDQEQPAPPLMTSPIQLMPIRSIGGGSQAGREPAPGSSPTDTGSRALSLDEFANTPPVSSAERPDLGLSHPSTPPPSFRRMATAPAIHQTLSDSTHNVSRSPPLHSPGPVTPRSPVTPGSSQLREGSLASPQLPATPPQPANTIGVRSPRSGSKRRESTPKENRRNSRAASGTKGKGSSVMPPINVLIVEDNPINLTIMSTILKRRGIKHSVANNGQEAVDKWRVGGFHLVLMDIQLPVKSGIEATQEIREIERLNNIAFQDTPREEKPGFTERDSATPVSSPDHLPVIIVALTASSSPVDRIAALAAGCNDFLTKPVSLPWFQQKLLEWGSMSILSSFSHRRRRNPSSHTGGSSASLTANFDFDRTAAANKASEIASHLHIDRSVHHVIDTSPMKETASPVVETFQHPSIAVTGVSPGLSPEASESPPPSV